MEKENYSFRAIAIEVINENPKYSHSNIDIEDTVRTLRNKFKRLIEDRLGGDLSKIRENGNKKFSHEEARMIKIILTQLFTNTGMSAEILNDKKGDKPLGLKFALDFIQQLGELILEEGASEDEIQQWILFYDKLFRFSFLKLVDDCHKCIDKTSLQLDMTGDYKQQVAMMKGLTFAVQRKAVELLCKNAILCQNIMKYRKMTIDLNEVVSMADLYKGEDDQDVEMDRNLYEFMKKNPEIKSFVERTIDAKVEDVLGINENLQK